MESATKQFDEEQIRQLHKAEGITSSRASVSRVLMSLALFGSDSVALVLSGWAAVGIRAFLGEFSASGFLSLSQYFDPTIYARLIPALMIFILVYASRRLYPTIGLNRVDEMRLLTISTSLVVTLYATILFLLQQGLVYSRFVFALFWVLAILLVPISRVIMRRLLARLSLWGVPVGIVGSGPKTSWTAAFLASHPNLGFLPAILFDGAGEFDEDEKEPARVDLGILEHARSKALLKNIDTLVVIQDETPEHILASLVSEVNRSLPRIVMMPDLPQVSSIWVRPIDLGGVLALKIRSNLANPWQGFLKRTLDLALGLLLMLIALPVMALIAAAIKLDSRGSLFYSHRRIGYAGRYFKCRKFRTMVKDADERLQTYLILHAELREEWDTSQKLKDDPRITRVGKLLRKFSLDELPQLWNVLKGEMSLVGPRPIVDAETNHYGDGLGLYESVRPGMTGLWQVSGRNDIGYSTRVSLDSYYVRNWSVWLDLYILARTPIAVFSRDGAY